MISLYLKISAQKQITAINLPTSRLLDVMCNVDKKIMTKDPRTHYLKNDFRADSLSQIILGLDKSIKVLQDRMKEYAWYDGLWFREDSEPIYGLAFIAFQNYINGAIKDLINSTSDKTKYYKLRPKFKLYEKSDIELIIGLANYSKHKEDDGLLHEGTADILNSFGLDTSKEIDIDSSPIFEGLTILTENWNLFEIEALVKNWRTNLFNVGT